jgi:hypothetical protein
MPVPWEERVTLAEDADTGMRLERVTVDEFGPSFVVTEGGEPYGCARRKLDEARRGYEGRREFLVNARKWDAERKARRELKRAHARLRDLVIP